MGITRTSSASQLCPNTYSLYHSLATLLGPSRHRAGNLVTTHLVHSCVISVITLAVTTRSSHPSSLFLSHGSLDSLMTHSSLPFRNPVGTLFRRPVEETLYRKVYVVVICSPRRANRRQDADLSASRKQDAPPLTLSLSMFS